jgi:hypothetical protein
MATARKQPHFRTRNGKRRISQLIYRQVYSGAPAPYLLMTPEFEIIDANDAYLGATMRQRDSLAGLDMFEAFPDNPQLDGADGVANLKQSLIAARSSGSRQLMRVQRYDVIDPKGEWRLRYWRPVNWPVLDDAGSVLALVHHVIDVTGKVLAQRAAADDMLFRRAQAACDEALALKEETRRIIDRMVRRF